MWRRRLGNRGTGPIIIACIVVLTCGVYSISQATEALKLQSHQHAPAAPAAPAGDVSDRNQLNEQLDRWKSLFAQCESHLNSSMIEARDAAAGMRARCHADQVKQEKTHREALTKVDAMFAPFDHDPITQGVPDPDSSRTVPALIYLPPGVDPQSWLRLNAGFAARLAENSSTGILDTGGVLVPSASHPPVSFRHFPTAMCPAPCCRMTVGGLPASLLVCRPGATRLACNEDECAGKAVRLSTVSEPSWLFSGCCYRGLQLSIAMDLPEIPQGVETAHRSVPRSSPPPPRQHPSLDLPDDSPTGWKRLFRYGRVPLYPGELEDLYVGRTLKLAEQVAVRTFMAPLGASEWWMTDEMAFRVATFMRQVGVPVLTIGGTLLGTQRHHGNIPWDDDIDFLFLHAAFARLREHLPELRARLPGLELLFQSFYQLRISVPGRARLPAGNFSSPYLDGFPLVSYVNKPGTARMLLVEDLVAIENNTRALHYSFYFGGYRPPWARHDIFPIRFRPYNGYYVPVPHNPGSFLKGLGSPAELASTCVSRTWQHVLDILEPKPSGIRVSRPGYSRALWDPSVLSISDLLCLYLALSSWIFLSRIRVPVWLCCQSRIFSVDLSLFDRSVSVFLDILEPKPLCGSGPLPCSDLDPFYARVTDLPLDPVGLSRCTQFARWATDRLRALAANGSAPAWVGAALAPLAPDEVFQPTAPDSKQPPAVSQLRMAHNRVIHTQFAVPLANAGLPDCLVYGQVYPPEVTHFAMRMPYRPVGSIHYLHSIVCDPAPGAHELVGHVHFFGTTEQVADEEQDGTAAPTEAPSTQSAGGAVGTRP
ncbi:hypothetical protein PAPYR_8570 [Paratrimastix pyriformis]|uniref:LicD/FKTN/FKRP nucleotidyltransferase domain-containing protein n=1 Tax=Paratrimastix pyriformis TaxID=342808 RepID=A0ABQ8UDW4_9EUKA|nr:hypothetical protein PAPYR_8570 [Paratrimastix pyriformis]